MGGLKGRLSGQHLPASSGRVAHTCKRLDYQQANSSRTLICAHLLQARAGLIKNFTGIDDPYEPPVNPEIRVACFDAGACLQQG